MTQRPVQIRVDDRVRLMSAVLAATKWPEREQQVQRHRPHSHARNTTKRVERQKHHPAIEAAQVLLDKGAPPEALYTYSLKLTWPDMEDPYAPRWVPPKWNEQLKNYYQVAELEQWWKEEDEQWQKGREEAEKLISKVNFYSLSASPRRASHGVTMPLGLLTKTRATYIHTRLAIMPAC
jgi:hypothetical protein